MRPKRPPNPKPATLAAPPSKGDGDGACVGATGAPDADGAAGAGAGEPAGTVAAGALGVKTLVVATAVVVVNGPLVTVTVALALAV